MYSFLCGHKFLFLCDISLGVEILGHRVMLCLTFWGTTSLFSKATEQVYILVSSAQSFQFLHILPNIYYYLTFLLYPF